MAGAEVNIDDKGELDIDKPALKKLDIVVGSIHSGHRGSKAKITNRICTAMQNPRMHILGHPTGRLINKRPSYAVDINKMLATAKKTGTALEIDAQPARFDLPTSIIRRAKEMGIKMSISSDAHAVDQLVYQYYGILHARRGWVEKKDILNTKTVSQLKSWAKK